MRAIAMTKKQARALGLRATGRGSLAQEGTSGCVRVMMPIVGKKKPLHKRKG